MNDKGKIILGLIVFIILMTFPVWWNLFGGVAPMEDPIVQTKDVPGKDQCVRPVEYMKARHMDLLNEWRDEVVREGERFTEGPDGSIIEKSLSNTCMDCHSNKDTFCDRCHNYMAVSPYCWDCHLMPDEMAEIEMAMETESGEEN
jgi:hypothetical protein